jgi:transcription initiation factor TFIID subunit 8
MTSFLSKVRVSMASARRTDSIPHDWIYALSNSGLKGSSVLEQHLDTGEVPPSLLQPHFDPPEPPEPKPLDLEGLLGPELSGKAEKESRAYIPKHFPPFPSKHTYKSTPVFAKRENDPRRIREKAAEEGIQAEKSLRKLMVEQKKGLQNRKGGKRKVSARIAKNQEMLQAAMEDSLEDDKKRVEAFRRKRAIQEQDLGEHWENAEAVPSQARPERRGVLEEGVHFEGVNVNYERKFYRKSARGG